METLRWGYLFMLRCIKYLWMTSILMMVCGHQYASAQLTVQIGVAGFTPIVDESFNVLEGEGTNPIDCVLFLEVDENGDILPPDPVTGEPHPDNPMVASGKTRIGNQVPPQITQPGWFGYVLGGGLGGSEIGGKTIFARVYNANEPTNATFYGDSQTFLVPTTGAPEFWIIVPRTDQPIDPSADQDGDTLTDGEEIQMGTDPNEADTDQDGFDDPIELLAGTSATNELSFLGITQLYKGTNEVWHLGWDTVDSKTYQPQYFARTDLDGPVVFQDIGTMVTATSAYTEILLPPQFAPPISGETQAFYRVYLDVPLP